MVSHQVFGLLQVEVAIDPGRIGEGLHSDDRRQDPGDGQGPRQETPHKTRLQLKLQTFLLGEISRDRPWAPVYSLITISLSPTIFQVPEKARVELGWESSWLAPYP